MLNENIQIQCMLCREHTATQQIKYQYSVTSTLRMIANVCRDCLVGKLDRIRSSPAQEIISHRPFI